MKKVAHELVFNMIMLLSYMVLWPKSRVVAIFALLSGLLILISRISDAIKETRDNERHYVENSRRASYWWLLVHAIVCIVVAIEEIYFAILIGVGVVAYIISLIIGIIKDGNINPLANIEKRWVSRYDIDEITCYTMFLCVYNLFLDIAKSEGAVRLGFVIFIAVCRKLYSKIIMQIIKSKSQ